MGRRRLALRDYLLELGLLIGTIAFAVYLLLKW